MDPKGAKDGIHDLIETALYDRRLPMSMIRVNSVVIRMVFGNTNGDGRSSKALSFRVSHPNSCNLKDSPEELIAKKYLKEWKIERD